MIEISAYVTKIDMDLVTSFTGKVLSLYRLYSPRRCRNGSLAVNGKLRGKLYSSNLLVL